MLMAAEHATRQRSNQAAFLCIWMNTPMEGECDSDIITSFQHSKLKYRIDATLKVLQANPLAKEREGDRSARQTPKIRVS